MLDRNLAVHFHPELDVQILLGWLVNGGDDEARKVGIDPDTLLADTRRSTVDSRLRAHRLVDAFLARLAAFNGGSDDRPRHESPPTAARRLGPIDDELILAAEADQVAGDDIGEPLEVGGGFGGRQQRQAVLPRLQRAAAEVEGQAA